jgi:sarcosine oxidase subunit gamma
MRTLEWTRRHEHERFAVKGPHAAEWLLAQGLSIPAQSNTWAAVPAQNSGNQTLMTARLGTSEFFFDEASPAPVIAGLAYALRERPAGVYPVLREDWGFVLAGAGSDAVLAEVCNVPFASLTAETQPIVMTMMVGVAVLVLLQAASQGRAYHVWCDQTFGPYLAETIAAVVAGHAGRSGD